MGVGLESIAIGQSQVHVIDTGNLQLQSSVAVGLESVQLVKDIRVLVRITAKVISIDGELKFRIREGDGQLELLIDNKRETTIAFLCQPAGRTETD